MTRKNDPPFGLDMSFAEALARFAQTDMDELTEQPSTRIRKRRMRGDGEPFTFTLNVTEIGWITDGDVVGSGGLQSLLRKMREQLEHGNVVSLDNAGLGQLVRYTCRYGDGTFEKRLRQAFARSFLDLFTPLYEAERRGGN